MKLTLATLALAVLFLSGGCKVNTVGAACINDDECANDQNCVAGSDGGAAGSCAAGVRKFDSACAVLLQGVADRASSCYGGSPSDWLLAAGGTTICADLAADLNAPSAGFAFDPLLFGACQKNLAALTCDTLLLGQAAADNVLKFSERANDTATVNMLAACTSALQPKQHTGDACSTVADCEGGYCDASATCPGVCRAFMAVGSTCAATDRCTPGSTCLGAHCLPYAKQGETCGSSPCNPTLFCKGGTCEPRGAVGSACSSNVACAQNLRCLSGASGETCQPAKKLQDPCTANTNDPPCDLFLYCSSGGSCSAWPHAPGLTCGTLGTSGKSETALCLSSYCSTHNLVTFNCEAYVPTGGGCQGIGALGSCGPDGQCVNDVCRPRNCP